MVNIANRLRIKRVYEPADDADGTRVLVDRIWPRGVSKAKVDIWLKDLAPSTELRKWFNHEVERWPEFRRRYRAELAENPDGIRQVLDLIDEGPVTLLFGAHDAEHNQAVVLMEYLQKNTHRDATGA